MKPLEILSAIPKWAGAKPVQIVGSPAFALSCRLGDESAVLKLGAVEGGDTLGLDILFGSESHALAISRSPRFPELDRIWDSRTDVPDQILLALVEKECGVLFQALENAVRRQLRLVGLANPSAGSEARMLFAQVADISFALTRSNTVVTAFGSLRNIDLSHPDIRGESLLAAAEYAAFALPPADLASIAVGDAILIPEINTVQPRLVVDGRFVVDGTGVSPFLDDGLFRIVAEESRTVTLGEVFDAAEGSAGGLMVEGEPPSQLRLVHGGKTLAHGRLDRLGDQPAFIVETPTP